MSTPHQTIVGVFDHYGTALHALDDLVEAGFPRETIYISPQPDGEIKGGLASFFKGIFSDTRHADDADRYADEVRRGGTVVSVTAKVQRASEAKDILLRNGPIVVDPEAAFWKDRGVLPGAGVGFGSK